MMFASLPPAAAAAATARPSGSSAAPHEQQLSRSTLRIQHLARTPSGFLLQYRGALVQATVRTPAIHALGAHMLPKVKRDTSKVLVSPMPGRLVSLAVKVGDSVEVGQELAIVEVRGRGREGGWGGVFISRRCALPHSHTLTHTRTHIRTLACTSPPCYYTTGHENAECPALQRKGSDQVHHHQGGCYPECGSSNSRL